MFLIRVYFHEIDEKKSVIVLSDFSSADYLLSKSQVNLSMDHITAAVKALGSFHGQFYALKHRNRSEFDALVSKLIRKPVHQSSLLQWQIENSIKRDIDTFRVMKYSYEADVTEDFLDHLQSLIVTNTLEFWEGHNRPREPLATVCHGDFLRNNVAFKYGEDGLATKAMLFDFQTMIHSSPMIDLNLFLSISVGYETRRKHLSDIQRAYHSALISTFIERTEVKENQLPEYLR